MKTNQQSSSHVGAADRDYTRRAIGLVLLLLVALPVYRLVGASNTNKIASDVTDAADVSRTLLLLGTLIALIFGIAASRFLERLDVEGKAAGFGHWLVSFRLPRYALILALISALICLGFSIIVLDGKPNLIDAMVQLTQARYAAAKQLAGPVGDLSPFWHLPNSIATPNGWVSQYPPGHVVLLALGMLVGSAVIVGPLLVGVTVFFTALSADRLLPEHKATARFGALLLALSPFLIGLGGAFMNHTAAAAFISIAVYAALRRAEGNFAWAVLSGAAVGATFSVRPLTGVVAAIIVAAIWLIPPKIPTRRVTSAFVTSALGAVLGGAPFLVLLGAYNSHFFGSPLRFGYSALVGPLVGPGFHRDPSGNWYGLPQAIAYTSSDLTTLSLYLFETPIPTCIIVALFLLLAPRLGRGTKIIAIWALLPVLANASYWHHGFFMGPRMLNEWTPAWALLTVISAVGLISLVPPRWQLGGYSLRDGLVIAFAGATLAGVFYLGPQRLERYGGPYLASSRVRVPTTPSPALVFVHGGWPTRLAMRLIARGMRQDSVEAALALNSTCDVQQFTDWYTAAPGARAGDPPAMNFDFSSGERPARMEIVRGDEIRYFESRPFPRACLPQVVSDTVGIIDTAPLMWQADLPGLPGRGTMVVRDLGPARNAALIARYPDRTPMVLLRREKEGRVETVSYAEGMKLLWPNE